MLPRIRRVPKKLFQQVVEHGKSYHSTYISLRIIKNPVEEPSRFAFSIPKKLDKRATRRNYLRRKGLSLLTPHLSTFPTGFVGVFFAKPGLNTISTIEYGQEIAFLIEKVSQL